MQFDDLLNLVAKEGRKKEKNGQGRKKKKLCKGRLKRYERFKRCGKIKN